ncbi:Nuclear receptor domain-containing protein [Caenorhabditis elegans]|uniref:Nuclear receptor domain-containing protein n=1 Tax=Caenorhabditis elegans TaxID=6239 RepID=G4SR04_CAEEL|nr:Nuclear receptor domain-containing protein [Caenorhabditis elegans]CCD74250.2 Nuclear receptor domain-containing protein [Caenorhabditis elegans]|eukprot:NP_001256013.2 Nuclear Hormone Receptor family [Caenorhabditis elegans]
MDPGLVCRICELQADGTHFGVVTCRACAVFFRRSTTSKWIKRKCMARSEDKLIIIVQAIWHVWSKVHKCASTALYRKSNPNAKPEQKIFRNMCMDRNLGKFDTSWMSDYSTEHVIRFMLTPNVYDFEIIEALGKLDPTDVESTFMFAQLCFEYAGKRFQGNILQITDRFQQVLSNDLHLYYTNDQRRNRYSQRLADLMKVNNLMQRSIWEARPPREIGRVFNISKIEFSHPEMFVDSGFT